MEEISRELTVVAIGVIETGKASNISVGNVQTWGKTGTPKD